MKYLFFLLKKKKKASKNHMPGNSMSSYPKTEGKASQLLI